MGVQIVASATARPSANAGGTGGSKCTSAQTAERAHRRPRRGATCGLAVVCSLTLIRQLSLSHRAPGFTLKPTMLRSPRVGQAATATLEAQVVASTAEEISTAEPMRVLIAGGGVGGLALANAMAKMPQIDVTVLEKTKAFKPFGGPIQLASNAMAVLKDQFPHLYDKIEAKATFTGNLTNGIKDGIRNEWYAMFDLKNPAADRGLPFTCVVERPDLQEIMLGGLPDGVMHNGAAVTSYAHNPGGGVTATLENGDQVQGDVLIGADGIWSATRATMHNNQPTGDGSGASYSGYTVYAGELNYVAPDHGDVGYKVFIGPNKYFVVTDIGKGRYQWYAFLAKPVGTHESEKMLKPTVEIDGCAPGNPAYLRQMFDGWSPDLLDIVRATRDDEIQQRDLYDRPPSVAEPWVEGQVALLGDAVHAMMPNLGQGGCQALEDAMVLSEELGGLKRRDQIAEALERYRRRRLIRSAAVQGLSRFASDIIIRGFDTPAKITDSGIENFNYAGIVTRVLQPVLPVFFKVQFNFLYNDWRNKFAIDLGATVGILLIGGLFLVAYAAVAGDVGILAALGLEGVLGSAESGGVVEAIQAVAPEIDSLL